MHSLTVAWRRPLGWRVGFSGEIVIDGRRYDAESHSDAMRTAILAIATTFLIGGVSLAMPINAPIGWVFIVLGLTGFLYVLFDWGRKRGWRWLRPRRVPLNEAARIAYEGTEGTPAAKVAKGLNKDDPLGYYVYALADGKIPVFGVHPPSTNRRLIDQAEFVGGLFVKDGEAYEEFHSRVVLFDQLSIRRKDLHQRIKELRRL